MKKSQLLLLCFIGLVLSGPKASLASESHPVVHPERIFNLSDSDGRFWGVPNSALDVVRSKEDSSSLFILDLQTGKELHHLKGIEGMVPETVRFSPDGKKMAVLYYRGVPDINWGTYAVYTVVIWDVQTGSKIRSLVEGPRRMSIYFGPEGKKVITASGIDNLKAQVWSIETGQLLDTVTSYGLGYAGQISLSPDGTQLIVSSRTDGIVGISGVWAIPIGAGDKRLLVRLHRKRAIYWSHEFSPDGSKLLLRDIYSHKSPLRVHDLQTGTLVYQIQGEKESIEKAYFSFDGTKIMTLTADGVTQIWDSGTGERLGNLEKNRSRERGGLQFRPGKGWVALRDTDDPTTWKIIETGTGKVVSELKGGPSNDYVSSHFSSDETELMVISRSQIHVWRINHYALRVSDLFGDLAKLQKILVPYKAKFATDLASEGNKLPGFSERPSNIYDYQVNTSYLFLLNALKPFMQSVDSEFFQQEVFPLYLKTLTAENEENQIESLLDFKRVGWSDPALISLKLVRVSAQSLKEALGQRVHQESLEKFLAALGKIEAQARVDNHGLTIEIEQELLGAFELIHSTLDQARSSHRTAPFVMMLESLREYFRG